MKKLRIQSFWWRHAFQVLKICTVDPHIARNHWAKCHLLHTKWLLKWQDTEVMHQTEMYMILTFLSEFNKLNWYNKGKYLWLQQLKAFHFNAAIWKLLLNSFELIQHLENYKSAFDYLSHLHYIFQVIIISTWATRVLTSRWTDKVKQANKTSPKMLGNSKPILFIQWFTL